MAVALDGSRAPSDEHARIFREAQRAADTIFSHYQLSQLLATHALPDSMSQAVLDELVHVCDAVGGALWLVRLVVAEDRIGGALRLSKDAGVLVRRRA